MKAGQGFGPPGIFPGALSKTVGAARFNFSGTDRTLEGHKQS